MIKERDRYLLFLKYVPMIQMIGMICYLVLYTHVGRCAPWIEMLFSCSLLSCIRLLTISRYLGYCRLHRTFILYNSVVYVFITLVKSFGSFSGAEFAGRALVIIGLVLTVCGLLKPFRCRVLVHHAVSACLIRMRSRFR